MVAEYSHIETPVFEDLRLGEQLGKPVWLKMECFQATGSFKIRGVGLLCQEQVRRGARELICSSGGNAGYAVAYAGHRLHVPVTVCVPTTTLRQTCTRLEELGATVKIHGDVWDETDQFARAKANGSTTAYIPPFDHPTLWRGHATMVDEMTAQCAKPGAIIVSVGGGGLLCGVLEGLHNNAWNDVPVIAVETEGAESFHAAVEAGYPVTLPAITSVATCLGAKQVVGRALEWTHEHCIQSVVVSDRSAVHACLEFARDHRVLVEPACGASLALLYDNHAAIAGAESVLAVVCGGIGVSIEQLESWWRVLEADGAHSSP